MYDRTSTVAGITTWPSLGVKLPKPLAEKLDVFDAVRYVEIGHAVHVDFSAITTENADQAVAELATRILPTQSGPGEPSALTLAKNALLDRLAGEILTEASQAIPGLIEQLRPGFERAVSTFVEAVNGLPSELTSEALVAAGPSTLADYQSAREAAQFIHTVDSWLAGLTDLPAFAGMTTLPALRVLSPASRGELLKLKTAYERRSVDPVELELGKLFACAAREGIAFALNTPRESAQIRQTIEAAPREKQRGVAYAR